MKLKCIKNTKETGIFTKTEVKIEGITLNKTYDAFAVPIVSSLLNQTDIELKDIKFLIFNDLNHWEAYDKRLFAPTL